MRSSWASKFASMRATSLARSSAESRIAVASGSSGRSFRVGLFGDSASVNTGFVTDPLGLDLCFASQRFYLRPRGLAKVV